MKLPGVIEIVVISIKTKQKSATVADFLDTALVNPVISDFSIFD